MNKVSIIFVATYEPNERGKHPIRDYNLFISLSIYLSLYQSYTCFGLSVYPKKFNLFIKKEHKTKRKHLLSYWYTLTQMLNNSIHS